MARRNVHFNPYQRAAYEAERDRWVRQARLDVERRRLVEEAGETSPSEPEPDSSP